MPAPGTADGPCRGPLLPAVVALAALFMAIEMGILWGRNRSEGHILNNQCIFLSFFRKQGSGENKQQRPSEREEQPRRKRKRKRVGEGRESIYMGVAAAGMATYLARRAAQRERVRILYRRALKDTLNWAVHRHLFYQDVYPSTSTSTSPDLFFFFFFQSFRSYS